MHIGEAKSIAEAILYHFSDGVEKAEIAGSIRRKVREIGEIDLVVKPKYTVYMGFTDTSVNPIVQSRNYCEYLVRR
jgi:DNA polymerase/3'-5' exonuclease PolX